MSPDSPVPPAGQPRPIAAGASPSQLLNLPEPFQPLVRWIRQRRQVSLAEIRDFVGSEAVATAMVQALQDWQLLELLPIEGTGISASAPGSSSSSDLELTPTDPPTDTSTDQRRYRLRLKARSRLSSRSALWQVLDAAESDSDQGHE